MGNVENAIAAALKRDGVEPPKLPQPPSSSQESAPAEDDSNAARRCAKAKKNKRRDLEKELRKVSKYTNVLKS